MKSRLLFLALLLVSFWGPETIANAGTGDGPFIEYLPVIQAVDDGWDYVGEGVSYQHFILSDPNHVYVARMDRDNQSAFLESAIGTGELAGGRETVSSMAARYDQAINYWNGTWGGRNRVVVAINGDYFNPATGYPENGQIQSGWYSKRYNDFEGWSGFVWMMDRNAFIGQCIVNPPDRQYITFLNSGNIQPINGVNAPRGNDELVIYTPQFASNTKTDGSGVEVLVEMSRPLTVVPQPRSVNGRVVAIRDNRGATLIPFDSVVISATGKARDILLANVQEGDEIGFSQEIRSYDADCQTPYPGDWSSAYAGIGGAFTFLRDGEPQHLDVIGATARNPRTAIAYNDQFIYFIVVDGRAPGISVGMSLDELAVFAKDQLGATWGIAQDGGGSSTMVVNGKVVNVPSDQCKKVYLPHVNRDLAEKSNRPGMVETQVDVTLDEQSPLCERQVANGMMMVNYEPVALSQNYIVGNQVYTRATTEVRLGPGTNYGLVGVVPIETLGQIVLHPTGLDGVEAKGTNWWDVSFGDVSGWVSEADLDILRPTTNLLPMDR